MTEPTTDLRDAIASALEETEQTAPAAPVSEPTPSIDDAPAPVEAAHDEPAAAPEASADLNALAEGETADSQEVQQRERDDQGRFAKKQQEAQQQEGIQPGPKSGPRQQGEKAPASWRPDVREHWASLPETVRAEIHRREVEVQRTLQETAEARKTAESINQVINPYMPFIKAEGSNPIQAIDNLMSTAARLRTGTAPELATMVAGIVKQFGIGRFGSQFINQLDAALAGEAVVDPQVSQLDQLVQQKIAPVQQFMTQFQQMQAQQQARIQQEAASEVSNFLEQAEFGNDVREDMADLLEAAQRRGQNLSLVDAYKKACMMNDRVRAVMAQRAKAKGAQQTTQAAQRARAAAVSVSGAAPMGAMRQEATDVRSAIEAAIASNNR